MYKWSKWLFIGLGLVALSSLLIGCLPQTAAVSDSSAAPAPRLPAMIESHFVTVAGQKVYYEVGGQGSPVVLVHGVGGGNSGYQWVKNTAALAASHRVYVLDIPGFARSPAQMQQYTAKLYVQSLEEFLEKVVGQPSAVVASSLPAAYSIDIAARRPELISKLLLVSPTGLDRLVSAPNPGFYNALTQSPLGSVIAATLKGRPGLNYFLYNQVYLDKNQVGPAITSIYEGNLQGYAKAYPVFAFISQYLNLEIKDQWLKMTQPSRIVWGSEDVNTPPSSAKLFQDLKPVTVDILQARAIPNDEQAEKFNAIALEFLK